MENNIKVEKEDDNSKSMTNGKSKATENDIPQENVPNEQINKISKSICKISYYNEKSTGFFMNFSSFKLLVTNFHVISEELLNKSIEIEMFNMQKKIIELDRKIRHIEFFEDPIDITIIEIVDDEIIKNVDFLDYDPREYTQYENEKDLDIFTSGYPYGNQYVSVSGHIISINDYEFEHDIFSEACDSGSPFILLSNLKVMGIYKQDNKDHNMGTFISAIFDKLENLKYDSKIKDIKI